jgi:chromosome segregation ATPase
VKLLEGNLRIRKAQTVHQEQIQGLFTGKDDPDAEYTKAETIFTTTRDTYKSAHEALTRVIADNDDPATYLAQITNRNTKTFQVNATLPEVAAQWLRDQPDVQRVVQIEDDLGDIQDNIDAANRYIERLDAVLAQPDKTTAFPALAAHRSAIADVRADVMKQLSALADAEFELASKAGGDTAELQGAHLALGKAQAAFADIPAQRAQAIEQVTELRNQLDQLEQQLSESAVVINSVNATGAAIRKYMADEGTAISPALEESVEQSLAKLGPDVDSEQAEIDDIRREITLARDATAPGDPVGPQEKAARAALLAALDEQHQAAAKVLGSASSDEQKIGTLTAQARRIAQNLDATDAQIDASAAAALSNVTAALAKQKADLASYQQEFADDETESKSLGGTVLGQSFRDVKSKFYDVIVRADVGVIDVSWSRREESEDELKRLTLEKQREAKQIRDEFRGVIDDGSQAPAPAPTPPPAAPSDNGGGK